MGQMSQLRVMFYGTVKVKWCLSRACHTMALEASDARSVAVPCSHPTILSLGFGLSLTWLHGSNALLFSINVTSILDPILLRHDLLSVSI